MDVGHELRGYREDQGLKRPEVSERTGITVAQLSRIETTGNASIDEESTLRAFYGAPNVDVAGSVTGTPGEDTWHGLSKGSPVKVRGKARATFTFTRYVAVEGKEPYVEVSGGKSGHRAVYTVRPGSVLDMRGRPVMER